MSELKSQMQAGSQVGSMSSLGLDSDLEAEMMGSSSTRRSTIDDRHRDVIRRMEKERKEAQEVCTSNITILLC